MALWPVGFGCRPLDVPEAGLTVDARDFAFLTPRALQAGRVTIRLRNFGPAFHHVVLLRLRSADSADAVIAQLRQWYNDPDRPIPGTVSIGGPEGRWPTGESYVTVDLEPGEYLIACTIPFADGAPHAARGMYARLTVGPGLSTVQKPPVSRVEPDLVIRATDYAYTLSTDRVRRGWRTLRFQNGGAVEHIAEIAALKGDMTLKDLLEWAAGIRTIDEPMITIGGSTRLATGRSSDIQVDLRPGRYVVLCMLHVPGGPPHLRRGMAKEFLVE